MERDAAGCWGMGAEGLRIEEEEQLVPVSKENG